MKPSVPIKTTRSYPLPPSPVNESTVSESTDNDFPDDELADAAGPSIRGGASRRGLKQPRKNALSLSTRPLVKDTSASASDSSNGRKNRKRPTHARKRRRQVNTDYDAELFNGSKPVSPSQRLPSQTRHHLFPSTSPSTASPAAKQPKSPAPSQKRSTANSAGYVPRPSSSRSFQFAEAIVDDTGRRRRRHSFESERLEAAARAAKRAKEEDQDTEDGALDADDETAAAATPTMPSRNRQGRRIKSEEEDEDVQPLLDKRVSPRQRIRKVLEDSPKVKDEPLDETL